MKAVSAGVREFYEFHRVEGRGPLRERRERRLEFGGVAELERRSGDDGLVGQQLFAGEATRLAYGTEEAKEGREAFVQKRKRNFKKFPWSY